MKIKNPKKFFDTKSGEAGQVLIFALIFVLVIMTLSGVLVASVFVYYHNGQLAIAQEQALHLAEAGIDKAVYEINQSGGGGYTGESNIALGAGVYTVTVSSVGSKKVIESTGFIPNATNPQATRAVRVEMNTSSAGVSFIYGVQVGYGGLIMHNNSLITGSVYSNGSVTGEQNTEVTGDVWVAGGVSPSPDQQQTIQTGEQNVGDTNARLDAGQSFIPGVIQVISRVSLLLKKTGNPSDATIRIVTDNSGAPSNNSIASGTLNSASVGTNFGWIDVSFTTNPQLISGQSYWIVFDTNNSSGTRYYTWAKHDNSGYGNGVGLYSTNWSAAPAVWNDATGDFGFKTWMGSGNTILTSMEIGAHAHANTITNSTIAGDAYYQSISGSTVGGVSYPGTADPPTLDMPITDSVISDFEALAAAGGTITPPTGTYTVTGTTTLGPIKIAGDLLIDNNAIVTLTGPVWVEGNIILTNNVSITLDAAFGSDSTMIIADYPSDPYAKGKITVTNNAQVNGSGDPNSYIMLLSTYSNPNSPAIAVYNNTDGAIFYTSAGEVLVNNNVSLKEVLGYRLVLSNNASVTYESGLADVNFSAGPSGGWILKRGSWQLLSP